MANPFGSFPFDAAGVDKYSHPIFINPTNRPPSVSDVYPPGTEWLYNNEIYQTTGAGNWNIGGVAPASTSLFGSVKLSTLAQLEAGNAPTGSIVPLANDVYTFVNTYASAGGVPATVNAQGIVFLAANTDVVPPYTYSKGPNEALTPSNITTMMATPGPIGSGTASTGAFTTLAASGTLMVTGATTLSSTLAAGNTSITGTLGVSGTSTIAALSATSGTFSTTLGVTGLSTLGAITSLGNFSLNASGGGTTTIGNSASTGQIDIEVGSGNFVLNGNGHSISFGTDLNSNTINVGNNTSATHVNVQVGTGNSNGDFLVDGVTSSKIFMGTSLTTGLINIGGTAQTGSITIGSSTGTANSVLIANGSGSTTVSLANATTAGATVNVMNAGAIATTSTFNLFSGSTPSAALTANILAGATPANSSIINIATGAQSAGTSQFNLFTGNITGGTQTVNIGTGTGALTLNLATGGTGIKNINIGSGSAPNVIVIGSTTASASLMLQSGSGGNTLIAGNASATITLGATAQTGQINIGNSSGALATYIMSGTPSTGTQTLHLMDGVATGGTQTISIFSSTASATAQNLNIFNGVNTDTNQINVSTTTGSPVVASIMTGVPASGTHTYTLGSATGLSTYTATASTSYTVAIGANNNIILSTTGGNYRGKSANTAPSAGFIGEQIRATVASGSAVSLTTTVAAQVASISLTAGIWDVSGIVNFTGITTGTVQLASINYISPTISTQGDNAVSAAWTSTTNADVSLVIPAYRIPLNTTTTVYLVAQASFTVGTGAAYGRISATRVA